MNVTVNVVASFYCYPKFYQILHTFVTGWHSISFDYLCKESGRNNLWTWNCGCTPEGVSNRGWVFGCRQQLDKRNHAVKIWSTSNMICSRYMHACKDLMWFEYEQECSIYVARNSGVAPLPNRTPTPHHLWLLHDQITVYVYAPDSVILKIDHSLCCIVV